MPELTYLKPNPKPGRPVLVRDPLTGQKMPDEGAFVDMTPKAGNHERRMYFTTLLRRGDVARAEPPASGKPGKVKE
ncbi:hypothetical protein [Desulfarculus baarsii]